MSLNQRCFQKGFQKFWNSYLATRNFRYVRSPFSTLQFLYSNINANTHRTIDITRIAEIMQQDLNTHITSTDSDTDPTAPPNFETETELNPQPHNFSLANGSGNKHIVYYVLICTMLYSLTIVWSVNSSMLRRRRGNTSKTKKKYSKKKAVIWIIFTPSKQTKPDDT